MPEIRNIVHPVYREKKDDWVKYRLTMEGVTQYITDYLRKYTDSESDTSFNNRKKITYIPRFAASSVTEVRNAIFQRIVDVVRKGGPATYLDAVEGKGSGIDNSGSSMNSLIGQKILPELLSMGKIGVLIDAPRDRGQTTDVITTPYVTIYTTEQIKSWYYDPTGELQSLLLEETGFDLVLGLPTKETKQWRYLNRTDAGIEYSIHKVKDSKEFVVETGILPYTKIPFTVFELNDSLLKDIADYQIAMMNICSSDLGYLLQSNFPLYTEQVDGMAVSPYIKNAIDDADGDDPETNVKEVGTKHGIQYDKGMERPGFISPPPEILEISMLKQDKMKLEIRQLLQLAVSSIEPKSASAESKAMDSRGLEAGLSYIALVLQKGENDISALWSMIEKVSDVAEVKYPDRYSLKSEAEITAELASLRAAVKESPSQTQRKELWKRIVDLQLGPKITHKQLMVIHSEIDDQLNPLVDVDSVIAAHTAGLVGDETASLSLGYQPGEEIKAAVDHGERIGRVVVAQGQNVENSGESDDR